MSTKKHLGQIGLGVLLLGVIATIIVSIMCQDKRLLPHAIRIADAPEQASPARVGIARGAHYHWLSNEVALGMTFDNYHDNAFFLNARTGATTSFTSLNTTLQLITPTGEQRLSPDGKWLLWTGILNAQHIAPVYGKRYVVPQIGPNFDSYRVVATAVDGSRQVDRQQGGNIAWLPNSKGWIRLVDRRKQNSIQTFIEVQTLASSQKTEIGLPHSATLPGYHKVLGVLPDDRLLLSSFAHSVSGHTISLCTISLKPENPSVHPYPISLPSAWQVKDVILSPRGDLLAWQAVRRSERLPQFLHRFAILAAHEGQPIISLWVSNLDGSHLYEVGEVDAPRIDGWDLYLHDLNWLPDQKHLSFIFRGTLWTVPVR